MSIAEEIVVVEEGGYDGGGSPSTEGNLLDSLCREETIRQVQAAVLRLPTDERSTLKLYAGLDGGEPMKVGEIAEFLGTPRNEVLATLARAFHHLKSNLADLAFEEAY